jgi:hypothetical protein
MTLDSACLKLDGELTATTVSRGLDFMRLGTLGYHAAKEGHARGRAEAMDWAFLFAATLALVLAEDRNHTTRTPRVLSELRLVQ